MKKITLLIFITGIFYSNVFSQNILKGIIKESQTNKPIQKAIVSIKKTTKVSLTNELGFFELQNITSGNNTLLIKAEGFEDKEIKLVINENVTNLGSILLSKKPLDIDTEGTITLNEDELIEQDNFDGNIAGLLQSTRNIYLKTAAFEWSSSFYRIRGLDSEDEKVLINGIEMNKLHDGRPQWSNWGGLNEVFRNQEISFGLSPSQYSFGGARGSSNISTRASEYRKTRKISYASSNRSYSNRVMATYTSGILKNGWAFALSASRRFGNEGFNDGTPYEANSFFASVEKKLNPNHSLNLTAIYAKNRRGKSAPHTQEVYDIKGIKYNEYWGYQNGKKRNSRIKRIEEPILILNHFWNISENSRLQTNIAYQFGMTGNSRLDYNGAKKFGTNNYAAPGANPSPVYYRNLPSFYVSKNTPDYASAYQVEKELLKNGQIDWQKIYQTNLSSQMDGNSVYALYEDRTDDRQLSANTIFNTAINDNIDITTSLNYTKLTSQNYAKMLDLLGGKRYLDIDKYGNSSEEKQADLLNPDRLVNEGDRFKYNYELESNKISGFAQLLFSYSNIDFYIAGDISKTSHQRNGLFQNGGFKNTSLGKSDKVVFTNFSTKAGLTYKLSGRHLLDFNAGFFNTAPKIRNTFSNPRENNGTVKNLTSKQLLSVDASYILRTPWVTSKVSGFFIESKNETTINYFFADGIGGDGSAFIQEITTGLGKRYIGTEIGIESQITPTLKLKGAANIGQYTYLNNPNVYVTTEANIKSTEAGFTDGYKDFGKASLKNYKLANGPQKVYSVGFEYSDPNYWWIGVTGNLISEAYIGVSPLLRTENFGVDYDGLPFHDYDPVVAKQLLQQEKIDTYTTVNLVGGKSWRIGKFYISSFLGINNALNTKYKNGGFESSRNANYKNLKENKQYENPINGTKYWYGRGTTYFLNINFRF